MSFVELIKRNNEQEISLTALIKETYKEKRRRAPLTEDDWLRVSSIGAICEREEVLCSIHKVDRDETIDGDSGMNFEHGHAVHWMFQSRILPAIGVIIGGWRCTYCGTQYGSRQDGFIPRPARCYRCGAIAGERSREDGRPDMNANDNAFVFVEEWIGNEQYKIGGSPDGQMMAEFNPDYKPEDLTLLEIKSANERSFVKVKDSPDYVHVIQTQLYMWLSEYRKAKIIYFNKNDRGTIGLREYDMDYDEECVERVLATVKLIRDGISTKSAPPRIVCASSDCQRAFRCKVKNVCFSE